MSTEKKIRVLVTGATGFLGSNILRAMAVQPGVEPVAACRRREQFDWMLQQEALAAGATFLGPFPVTGPRLEDGRVAGASLAHAQTGESVDVDARVTLLATGAATKPLQLFGVCTRPGASAMAARAYFRLPPDLADQEQSLVISYDRAICPGYGWIFPGPDNVFNIGVGVFTDSSPDASVRNLRRLFDRFLAQFPPAARISDAGEKLSDLKGAPLRMAMTGARFPVGITPRRSVRWRACRSGNAGSADRRSRCANCTSGRGAWAPWPAAAEQ